MSRPSNGQPSALLTQSWNEPGSVNASSGQLPLLSTNVRSARRAMSSQLQPSQPGGLRPGPAGSNLCCNHIASSTSRTRGGLMRDSKVMSPGSRPFKSHTTSNCLVGRTFTQTATLPSRRPQCIEHASSASKLRSSGRQRIGCKGAKPWNQFRNIDTTMVQRRDHFARTKSRSRCPSGGQRRNSNHKLATSSYNTRGNALHALR